MRIRKKTTMEIVRGLLRKPPIVAEDAEVRLGFFPPCYYEGHPIGTNNGCYMSYVSVFPYRKEIRVWVGADSIFNIPETVYTDSPGHRYYEDNVIYLPIREFEKSVLAHEVPDTWEVY